MDLCNFLKINPSILNESKIEEFIANASRICNIQRVIPSHISYFVDRYVDLEACHPVEEILQIRLI